MHLKKLLFASIILVSCTSELPDVPDQSDQEQGTPVQFSYSIQSCVSIDTDTRAIIEAEEFSSSDENSIGIFALRGTGTGDDFVATNIPTNKWNRSNFQNNFFNEPFKHEEKDNYSGSKYIRTYSLTSNKACLMPADPERLCFYAYYPYTEDINYATSTAKVPKIPVSINSNLQETTDYLYTGAVNGYTKGDIINIPFKHALGRLQIYICSNKRKKSGFLTITNFQITTWGNQNGYLKIDDGFIEYASGGTDEFTYTLSSNNEIKNTEFPSSPNLDTLLFPNAYDTGNLNPELEDSQIYQITMQLSDGKSYSIYDAETIDDSQIIKIQRGKITKLFLTFNYK